MSLEDLYTDIILDHYRNPRAFGDPDEEVQLHAEGNNPLCGDEIHLFMNFENGELTSIQWKGEGCAISQASASMMVRKVQDVQNVEDIEELINQFRRMMRKELDEEAIQELGDLQAVQGVTKFPIRIKCAVLAWNTLQEALLNRDEDSREISYEEEMDEDEVPDQIPGPL